MASPNSVLACAVVFVAWAAPTAVANDDAAGREFTLKVLPLLKAKCFACHGDGDKAPKGGLDVTTRAALLKGGDSGEPSLTPGKPEASLLYSAVAWDELEMPPKENDRLTEAQVELVGRWITAGAPWPDETTRRK